LIQFFSWRNRDGGLAGTYKLELAPRRSKPIAFAAFVMLLGTLTIAANMCAVAQEKKSEAKSSSASKGDAANGKRLYFSDGCYECHGGEGQGSPLSGPRVAPDPIPFSALVQYLRHPSGQMPPYTSKVISEAELADIYAFLKSRPQPPAVQSVRILESGEKTSK
jgi:mono/diheme cytochrome c family protein